MIRKVYLDFLRDKLSRNETGWLLSRLKQFVLIHASFALGKPLCGPVLGTLVTNYSCNYSCVMCDLKRRDGELRSMGSEELDTAGMKKVIHAFARLGTPGIGFTGGEPLLRKDIFELLAHTKKLGMISHLNTNGSLLDDGNARKILEARVDSLNISIDGAKSATHDVIRGVQGAFDRAVAAVERITALRQRKGAKLRIKTVAVLQEDNVGEVPEMVRLAGDLGVDCIEFIPRQQFLSGCAGKQPYDPVFLEKVEQAVDRLFRSEQGLDRARIENSPTHLALFSRSFRNEPMPLKCYAGYNSLAVDCFGEIYPCVPWYNWRRSTANVRDHELEAFWFSPEYRNVRIEVERCTGCYLNCQTELNILFNMIRSITLGGRSRRAK